MVKNTSKPVPPASATPAAKGGSSASLNPVEWLKSILDFVTKNLSRIPKEQRMYVLLATLGAVLTLVGSILLFQAGQYLFGGALLLATLVLFAYAMRCAGQPSAISAQPRTVTPPPKSPTHEWSRVTVKVPIEQGELNKLEDYVRTVRTLAKKGYSDVLEGRKSPPSQTDPDSVRVNVFVPDTQKVLPDEVCTLFIPDCLHDGMINDEEERIRFRWDEGVTGQVFAREQPIGTRRTSATGEWEWISLEGMGGRADHKFQLTPAQMRLIDKKLRWIVSFPLKVDVMGKQHTVGVLNVDGLSEVLSPEEMQTIYNKLEPTVEDFAKRLAGWDKCRITTTVENI